MIEEEIQLSRLSIKLNRSLTEAEKKIFSIFIVGVNEEDLNEVVKIKIATLEKCLDFSEAEVIKALKAINEVVLYIWDSKEEEEYIIHPLEYVSYNLKEKKVKFKINNSIEGLFEEIKKVYFRINNSNTTNLKGKYSWKLYEVLKGLDINKSYYISIDYLKQILRVVNTYKLYADFKRKVILYSQKEICEKTDIKFIFEEKKEDKKIVGLYITVLKKNK